MRLTPRFAGPLEPEEYFTLPKAFRSPRSVELNRFAILPAYRKGKTFLPVVSLGLFKLALRLLEGMDAAPHGDRRQARAHLDVRVDGLPADRPHRPLRRARRLRALAARDRRPQGGPAPRGAPFEAFFCQIDYREVVLPRRLPSLGMGVDLPLRKTA